MSQLLYDPAPHDTSHTASLQIWRVYYGIPPPKYIRSDRLDNIVIRIEHHTFDGTARFQLSLEQNLLQTSQTFQAGQ